MNVPMTAVLLTVVFAGCSAVHEAPPPPEPWYPQVNAQGDSVFAVFESRVPCEDCEKIKVALALYRNGVTHAPTTYALASVYVGRQPEQGRTVAAGIWTIGRGTALDTAATVYQLDTNAPQEFRNFWAISDDILFILDQGQRPRVGTAGYGYALNRMR